MKTLLIAVALLLSGCQALEFAAYCADPAIQNHGPFCPKKGE